MKYCVLMMVIPNKYYCKAANACRNVRGWMVVIVYTYCYVAQFGMSPTRGGAVVLVMIVRTELHSQV